MTLALEWLVLSSMPMKMASRDIIRRVLQHRQSHRVRGYLPIHDSLPIHKSYADRRNIQYTIVATHFVSVDSASRHHFRGRCALLWTATATSATRRARSELSSFFKPTSKNRSNAHLRFQLLEP
mmetsp:Transcript_14687/g.40607  ORF Transcript_14687/g.40607 Transcript_14687/m.40607 type:complete len:124 (-) Transcript_14687:596-967(-)